MFGGFKRGGNNNAVNTSLQQQSSIKKGWLKKQGGVVKSWHRRWFNLKGDTLYYYGSEDESRSPLGSIFLPGNRVIEHAFNIDDPDRFLFEIVPGADKTKMSSTHDSYPICAATDDERREWVTVLRRVMYANVGGGIFGQTLKATMEYENRTSKRKVPYIVEQCSAFILKHGVEVEGIFRLPGRTALIKQLKEAYDCGERPEFVLPDVDIHTVASLLKLYLRELPEPLIPFTFYESVIKIVNRDMHENPDLAVGRLRQLLDKIPKHSYNMIQYVSQFLHQVSKHSEVTKMPEMNLATVFMQSIIRPDCDDPALYMGTAAQRTQVTFILINKSEDIFTMEYTTRGGAVRVDNLLGDLEGMQEEEKDKQFNVRTSSINRTSKDLLGLDLTEPISEDGGGLPSPLAPNASDVAEDLDFEVVGSMNGNTPENDDPGIHSSSSENISSGRNSLSLGSEDSLTFAGTGDGHVPARPAPQPPRPISMPPSRCEAPVYQVPPPPKRRPSLDEPPPIPRRPTLESTKQVPIKSPQASESGSPVMPTRQAPKPPGNKTLISSISVESLTPSLKEGEIEEIEEEDKAIHELVHKDVGSMTMEQLHNHISTLCSEVMTQREQYKDTLEKYQKLRVKQKKQLQDMAQKVDNEKTATANAVDKIIAIQTELQQYQMHYGPLEINFGK